MRRRTLLTGAPVAAASVVLPALAEPITDLYGLPLAAKYGRLAAQAMAHPGLGSWEMAIVTGDANQPFGFFHIGSGPALVRYRQIQLKRALELHYGGRFDVVAPDKAGARVARILGVA